MSLFDHIYPRFCLGCGKFGTYCCDTCVQRISKLRFFKCPECGKPAIDGITHPKCHAKFGLDGLISLYPYTGLVKKMVKQIKYRFAFRITSDIVKHADVDKLRFLQRLVGENEAYIVPIPLHISRQNFRGFNQSEIIAQQIGKRLSMRVANGVLVRTKMTVPQVDMINRNERLQNMKKVFAVSEPNQLQNTIILLVDDVFTTGATMRSATEVLKKAGAKFVWGVTLAQ